MISWFNRSRIRAYVKLSTRKQNKMKQEIDVRFAEQRSIMDSRLANAKDYARKADRLQSRGKEEKAKEALNSFKLELASSQPVLNACHATLNSFWRSCPWRPSSSRTYSAISGRT